MRYRSIVVVAIVTAALLCPRAVSAATLSQLQVEPVRGGGAHIRLSFSDVLPRYRLLGRGALEIVVEMRDVRAAPGVRTRVAGAGSVAGVRLVGSGTTAMLLIALNAPAAMHVTALAREIDVTVDPPGALSSPSGAVATPSTGPGQGDVVEVVPLKYADVSEIVGVLVEGQGIASNDTFAPQPSQLGQASPTFGGTFTGTYNGGFGQPLQQGVTPNAIVNGQQSLGQRVNQQIAVDRRLNAIILSGTAAQVTALRSIIEKLDVPLSSVVLETQIVELTETAAKSIGIDFSAGGGPVASGKYAIATLSPATASVSLQAAIYDVVSRGGGRLIARPRVVAL
ncbi:MAG TPA: secretin N-terminal domain-containing protein, partial [Candidatus Elarobacter sp.]